MTVKIYNIHWTSKIVKLSDQVKLMVKGSSIIMIPVLGLMQMVHCVVSIPRHNIIIHNFNLRKLRREILFLIKIKDYIYSILKTGNYPIICINTMQY